MKNRLKISNDLILTPIQMKDADEYFALIEKNRQYLRQWLPWLDFVKNVDAMKIIIGNALEQNKQSMGTTFSLKFKGKFSGVVSVFLTCNINRVGEIGYWLSEDMQGKGLVTSACREVLSYSFEHYELNRIQIVVAEDNFKSRLVPERLGFQLEGIMREREFLYTKFVNQAIYSILHHEFIAEKMSA